jgi:hypothetical protein
MGHVLENAESSFSGGICPIGSSAHRIPDSGSAKKNSVSSNSPLSETHFVSFLKYFSTPKSEEPKD